MSRPLIMLIFCVLCVLLAMFCPLYLVGDAAAQRPQLPSLAAPDFSKQAPMKVARVVDGDTIVVNSDHGPVTVRLIGVDTPETVHPSKPVEAYGKEASAFTANLLKGEEVYLIADPQQGSADKYGRSLAYVYRYPDGLFVNAEIIRQGYGHAYPNYPFRYLEEFRKLEGFARQAQKGLWAPAAAADASAGHPASAAAPVPPKPAAPPVAAAPPAAAAPTPAAPRTESVTVRVTKTGSKYHTAGCIYLRSSSIPISLEDAKARGCTPCSRCGPPR